MEKPHQPLTILTGDCRNLLKTLPEGSVHCCVTSPPYWGLRDYGHPEQLGREATPQRYIEAMRSVFSEVRRVLREDGTLWLNLGDSYCSTAPGTMGAPLRQQGILGAVRDITAQARVRMRPEIPEGLKPKDLVGIPWRVAFGLQADGWYLRSDIIWHKPNAMPESVTDRPTKAHEYVFLLTKSKRYYYDTEAIKEPSNPASVMRLLRGISDDHKYLNGVPGQSAHSCMRPRPNRRDKQRAYSRRHAGFNARWEATVSTGQACGRRNKRTVWIIPPRPYRGAHFATYPPDLVRPCILAGTSARGCCSRCGAPWKRLTEKGAPLADWRKRCGADRSGGYHGLATKAFGTAGVQDASAVKARILEGMRERRTVGWQPTCSCDKGEQVPCTVLDPFAGSGTTGQVALELGRRAVLIELNPDYVNLIGERCH